jgi:hypothetical protein
MTRSLRAGILLIAVAAIALGATAAPRPFQFTGAYEAAAHSTSVTLTSDKPDYHPGEIVTLSGSGWKPGEIVTIVMTVKPLTHDTVTLSAVADADGSFISNSYIIQKSDLGVTFTVSATGDKGSTAQMTFTDSATTTVSAITGNGTVVDNNTGDIVCTGTGGTLTGTCTFSYGSFTSVTLTAVAAPGWIFGSWTNSGTTTCMPSTNTCSFTAPSGNGHTVTVAATFIASPAATKTFSPTSIVVNGTSTLTISIANANAATMAGVAFTDTFPAGLQVAATPGLTNTCGGTITGGTAAATTLNLSGGSIAASSSCTISVSVTGTTTGAKVNTTSTVTSTSDGTGPAVAATLSVAVGTSDTVSSSVNPSAVGQSVTFSDNIAPASGATVPTGTVQFVVDGTNFGTPVTVTGTGCTPTPDACATSGATTTLAAGNHTVTANYTPAATTSTGTVTFTVTAGPNYGDTIKVGGITYTWVTGEPPTAVNQIFASASEANAAKDLEAAINGVASQCGDANCISASQTANPNATATAAGSITTITNTSTGAITFIDTFANGATYTLSPTTSSIAAPTYAFATSSGTLSGGQVVNYPVPTITTLSPNPVNAGSGAQTLTINGSNFVSTSTATYNGVAHSVTYTSSSVISISLTAGDVATAGTYPVIVTNPAPGGGTSNTVNLTVNNPVPTITTLSPATLAAGSASQTLTINGANFVTSSTATYNGVSHTVTYVSSVQVTITLTTGDLATAGTYPVVVTNPSPGGGSSNTANFVVYGAAAKLVFTTEPSTTAASLVAFATQPKVSVEDASGNVVITDNTDQVTLAITSGTGTAGAAFACTTNPVTAALGVASFAGCNINLVGSGYTLTATSGSLTSTISTTIAITPGAASKLIFTTQPGGGTGGVAWSQQPVVTVEDASGNTVTSGTGSNASITLAIGTNPSSGTLACTTNPLTATAGVATFAGCNINFAGTGYTLTAAATSLTGATSSPFNITAGTATKLAFTVQPSNTAAGASITPSPAVSVEDAGGNVVTSSTVAVTVAIGTNPGTSTLSGTLTVNAVSGVATFPGLSLNKTGTGYTLTAASSPLTGTTSVAFNITPGAPTQLVFTTQPSTPDTAGTAFGTQPKISIEDANGNVVTTGTGSTDSITLAIGTNPAGGTLTCTNNTVTAVAGVATFAACSINKSSASTYTLTGTDNTNTVTGATSNPITINPGTATKLIFTTAPSSTATGGTPFLQQPVVSVEDTNNNVVTSSAASVALAINTGTGTLTCTANTVTASSGVATFANCSLNTAGTYTLKATSTGLTQATSGNIVVSVGPAAKIAFTVQPSNTAAGSSITPAPAVSVEDAGGNIVTTSTDSITVAIGTNPGGSTLSGTATVGAVAGVATFSTLSLNKVGTAYTLTATDNTNVFTVVTSSTFNITPGTASQLLFTTQPGGGSGGVAWTTQPTVTVEDQFGNTVTGSTLSITLAIGTNPSSGTLACTANPKAAVAGVDTFAGCKINFAGTGYTLTASGTGVSSATSSPFNITVGTAALLAFGVQPSNTTSEQIITPAVTVLVEDAGGNFINTSTASIVIAIGTNPSSGTLSGTTTVSAVAGVATFSTLVINKAGTGYTLSATSTGLTTAISSAFNILAGPAAQIAFTVEPSNAAQGIAITPAVVVSVEDAGGNVVTSATDSITITIGTNPGSGTLSGTRTVSAASGVATFSTLSISAVGTGYTLNATDNTNSGFPVVASTSFNIITPSVSYTEPFNSGHGWTFTQVGSCTGTSCTNTPTENSANCGPLGTNGVGTLCVLAANEGGFLSVGASTTYVSNPAYTWQTLGVPANATVLTVQGGFWDKETGNCNSASASLKIFNSTGSTELTSTDLVPLLSVTGDTSGATHTGSVLNVTSSTASSSGILIEFGLDPAGTALFGTCDIYGDNVNLVITYSASSGGGSSGPKRRGQVIIGMNRHSDGSFSETWAYNVDLLDGATALTAADIKTLHLGKSETVLDPATFANRNITVSSINLEKN